jgi:hypothetical protein
MREQLEKIEELGGVTVPNASMTAAAMQIDGLVRKASAEQATIAAQQKAEFDANPFWHTRRAVEELLKRRASLKERRDEGKRAISKLKKEAERLAESSTSESEEVENRVFDLEREEEPIEESISSIEDELEDLKDELRLASRLREDFWLASFGKEFMGEYPVEQCPNYNPTVSRAFEVLGLNWQAPARRDVALLLSDLDQQFTEWDKFDPVDIFFREFGKRFPEKRKGFTNPKGRTQREIENVEAKQGCIGGLFILLFVARLIVLFFGT